LYEVLYNPPDYIPAPNPVFIIDEELPVQLTTDEVLPPEPDEEAQSEIEAILDDTLIVQEDLDELTLDLITDIYIL
jgi:hypothetical protein